MGLAPHDDNGFRTEPFLQEWMLSNLPGALQTAIPTITPTDLPGIYVRRALRDAACATILKLCRVHMFQFWLISWMSMYCRTPAI